ncbi:MAG: hypothetical protein ISR75_03515 [Phycisphaerales bacterium]|nr:hypothetical protein [Planctomycetota bacterium]MBL6997490.1 hypothetical protein [Phycisphaerales bacterium]
MSKSCKTGGGSCPAPWILGGAILGLVVGYFSDNISLWVGVGVAVGLALGLGRTSSCCGGGNHEDNASEEQETE